MAIPERSMIVMLSWGRKYRGAENATEQYSRDAPHDNLVASDLSLPSRLS
jgi:hypothetical protein